MSFSYANPTSGPSAGGIGWFNFANLTINPGDNIIGLTGTLNDGTSVTFDLSMTTILGPNRSFVATSTPTYPAARFGTTGYSGIVGNVALYQPLLAPIGITLLQVTNIVVKDSVGNIINNYTTIIADAESTDNGETWTWNTNGGGWKQVASLGAIMPTLVGLGTQTVLMTGIAVPFAAGAYVLSTQSPTSLNLTVSNISSSRQAIAIGFAITKVTVEKNIGDRIDPADQFVLDIDGIPNDQATTVGALNGIQTEKASVYATPDNSYTIDEAMALGSVSTLSQYTVIVSASNATPAGSVPPTGTLPINFTPILGDDVTYRILNAAPETFSKTVDKANADIGEILTYTVTVNNPNNFTVNNVLVTDATPSGTTYIGNLVVSAPYTGIDPSSGITITSIGPDVSVILTWQVQVSTAPPIQNPINNFASVSVPNGISGITNVASTVISHAFVSINKSVDKANADVGDTLTYTLTLNNVGNVDADNVVISDPIPTGTTYVAGSVAGTVPFTGTPASGLTLTSPIAAGGSAIFTYNILIDNSIPSVNPIPNSASLTYAYTVDPANPNGVVVEKISNTVLTEVSNATLTIVKTVDKTISYIGEKITYQLKVTNTGNVAANNVVIYDPIPNGTSFVPGSLSANVPVTGSPMTSITITNPIAPAETVFISFQIEVTAIPAPNPVVNVAEATFTYTVNPLDPDSVNGGATSNAVSTIVFKNNYSQQISDLIESIALEEAAIGNIVNAEGAKIQRMLSIPGVTPNQLICINKSVADMLETLGTLEAILKQKLSSVDCQINPTCL